jgi:hypothetical protein
LRPPHPAAGRGLAHDRAGAQSDRRGVGLWGMEPRKLWAGGCCQHQSMMAQRASAPFPEVHLMRSGGSTRPPASISGDHYDCDDNECRDQRKKAIECFRSALCDVVERKHGLCRWPQFANQPANISRLHRIRRYGDLFDMIAFRAVERANFKSRRPRRNACKHHARSASRAAESLNCEQWDCGQVVGHAFHLWLRRERKNSQSPVAAEEGGDETSMLSRFRSRCSILIIP